MRKEEARVKLNTFVIGCGHLKRSNSKHLETIARREVGLKVIDSVVQGANKLMRLGVCLGVHFGKRDKENQ